MTMNDGNANGLRAEINMTPMIDVLLVLLIIFMVIVPAMPRGESAQMPKSSHQTDSLSEPVVLEVLKGSGGMAAFTLNQQPISRVDLQARLAATYANRAERVLFVKGDDQLSFEAIAEVIDLSHTAGVDRIGLVTAKTEAGL